MGMFDSFYLESGEEVQTKQLECCSDAYGLGASVQSYVNFDGPTSNYYLYEEYENVGLIIINNIFLDWVRSDDTKQHTRELFNTYLANPELVAGKLTDIIQTKLLPAQQEANAKLASIHSALRDYDRFKNPPLTESKYSFLMNGDSYRRFTDGASLAEVITDILTDNQYE